MAASGPSYMSKEQVGQSSTHAPLFEVVDRLAMMLKLPLSYLNLS